MTTLLHAIRDTAEQIAREAGALIQEYAANGGATVDYKGEVNLLTAADTASEKLITDAIQAAFPDHHIHGEEGGGYGPPSDEAPYRWWVDPIDGTTNYAHGYPMYCVNLSVVDSSGEPVVGVTYEPNRDELFSAVKGEGAFLNGKPIHVTDNDEMLRALVVTGFPYDRHTAENNNTQAFAAFTRRAQGMRRSGAAALDIAYVACGRVDAYWERGPERWDYLAGILMVREAGGKVTTYLGEEDGPLYSTRALVATNGLLHDDMLAVLDEVESSFKA